jgi:hypothetical protein
MRDKGQKLAYLILFGIFFYLFATSCKSNKKINLKKYPHYPYLITKTYENEL